MQRPWQDTEPPRAIPAEQRSPERMQIPDIATALDRHLPLTVDHRLPPIATTFDSQISRPPDSIASAGFGSVRSSRPESPLRSPELRPEKRARWLWSQDSTPVFSARSEVQSYVSAIDYIFIGLLPIRCLRTRLTILFFQKQEDEKSRDAYTAWTKPDHPRRGSQQEGTCSNCAHTDELVARVVSGLLRLEVDIRYALALFKGPQNVSERCSDLSMVRSQTLTYFQNTSMIAEKKQ